RVGVDDPRDAGQRRVQIDRYAGQRAVDDGDVEHEHRGGDADDGKRLCGSACGTAKRMGVHGRAPSKVVVDCGKGSNGDLVGDLRATSRSPLIRLNTSASSRQAVRHKLLPDTAHDLEAAMQYVDNVVDAQTLDDLRSRITGTIAEPHDPAYEALASAWNLAVE